MRGQLPARRPQGQGERAGLGAPAQVAEGPGPAQVHGIQAPAVGHRRLRGRGRAVRGLLRPEVPGPARLRRRGAVGHGPGRGGELSSWRGLRNVTEGTWPIVLGWLVAAIFRDFAHPLLLLGGQQGAGKTTAARMLVGLFDPSPAPLRSQPRDLEQWSVCAAGSWGIVVDNISYITGWWSDALCRAVSGDGLVRRRLYTDSELSVLAFRRVIALTFRGITSKEAHAFWALEP